MPVEIVPFVTFYLRSIDKIVYLSNIHILDYIRRNYSEEAFEELLIHCHVRRAFPLPEGVLIFTPSAYPEVAITSTTQDQ